jgi:hypothetical protein
MSLSMMAVVVTAYRLVVDSTIVTTAVSGGVGGDMMTRERHGCFGCQVMVTKNLLPH